MNQQLKPESAESLGLIEAQHRYVNSLQLLSSMTRRELRSATTPEARASLSYIGELVVMFCDLHAQGREDRDLQARISNICRSWQRLGNGKVEIVFEAEPDVSCASQDQVMNISLIVQELLLNAIKHAFPGDRTGTIRVCLERGADNHAMLTVADDGVGAADSADCDPDRTVRASRGTDIIHSLANALGGTIQRGRNSGIGYKVSVRWVLSEELGLSRGRAPGCQ